MALRRLTTLALLAISFVGGTFAQDEDTFIESIDELPDNFDPNNPTSPGGLPGNAIHFKISSTVSFADDADVFGLKLVNNHVTKARFVFQNAEEDETLTVRMIGGSLWPLDSNLEAGVGAALRNLTTMGFNVDIAPQTNVSLEYPFATDLHPQDLRLLLAAIVESKSKGIQFQVDGYNGTVSIVDAPVSIFDLQLLAVYAIVAAAFAGTCYFIYNTWVTRFFPQAKKTSRRAGGRKGAPSRQQSQTSETKYSSESVSGIATGAKAYDESWIGAQHLQRPEAKRAKSSTSKTRAK